VTVKNSDEEAALGGGWADTPAAFNPYKGARRARTEDQDPVKWLDEWSVPGLLPEHRRNIKAQLLRADGVFDRSLDSDSTVLAMRQAFDGIARVLFEAGILTEDLLRKDVRQFVWDSAIAVQDQNAVDLVAGVVAAVALRPVADRDHRAQHFAAAGFDYAARSSLRGRIAVAGLAGRRVDLAHQSS